MTSNVLLHRQDLGVVVPAVQIPWCCPRCRAPLPNGNDRIDCSGCGAQYEVIDGIPDFRISTDFWLDIEQDRKIARELAARYSTDNMEGLIRQVYSARPEWDEARIALRTRQVLEAPERLRREIDGWLDPATHDAPFLEIGCGPGMLLAAAASKGRSGIGIDASLVWLVVSKRLITLWGGQPMLAAALADALPLADGAVQATISLDVIEHVADPQRFLQEVNRVTRVGGKVALATPNRFSLAAEPHVFVWGVGWLPRRWQPAFVRWRSGKSYDYTCLLGIWEFAGMMRRNTEFNFRILIPEISTEEIRRFPKYRQVLARLYNWLTARTIMRGLLLIICPFFRAVGMRQAPKLKNRSDHSTIGKNP